MRVICVDDEDSALQRFQILTKNLTELTLVQCFNDGYKAIEFAKNNPIDLAFLDIEMPTIKGIQVAEELKKIDENIRIVFATAYAEYALQAYGIDAIGYLLKPFSQQQLISVIEKAKRILPKPKRKVRIQTMPTFEVFIDNVLFPINSAKCKELLALLVDRNGGAVSAGYAIAYLWEDKEDSASTHSLYRMTFMRLREILADGNIEEIIGIQGQQRFINKSFSMECEYFDLLKGDMRVLEQYNGEYMSQYWWAEETNAKINKMANKYKNSHK